MGYRKIRDPERLLDLVALIYRAAANQAEWRELLADLGRLYEGKVFLFRHDYKAARVPFAVDSGLDPDMVASYKAHYGALNPWVLAQEAMPAGTVVLSHTLISERELLRSEYYNDWLKPQGLHFGLGSNILKEKGWALKLGILRGCRRGPMCRDALNMFRRLMPHLQSAFRLHDQLIRLEARAEALRASMERLDVGVVLVSPEGRAVDMNAAAHRLFAAEDGLNIGRGGVITCESPQAALLRPLIADAVRAGTGRSIDGCGGILSVPRPSGRLPYSLSVTPLCEGAIEYPVGVAAVVFICDPEREIDGDFGRLYGLTPAEVRLTLCLANGLSLKEAASRLGVTENTARCVSKRIFTKTGTHRQPELLRLLMNSVATLVLR